MKPAAEPAPAAAAPAAAALRELGRTIAAEEVKLREGGGAAGRERQHKLGRLTARERLAALLDPAPAGEPPGDERGAGANTTPSPDRFLELGLWAAHGLYREWGDFTAAGVITGIGRVAGRPVMLIANDATVKAGAFVPMTCKKILRAQRIAFECALPIVYLVDSSGVFLPMQDEVFPDEDDFGRIFRNNAVISAAGLPQFAAIMGNCVAGGAYLPVLCDKVLMTEGSGLYLAGPSLVKAAIGQEVDSESLGGAAMHAELSGTVDFKEKDDAACLARLRKLVALLPAPPGAATPPPPAATARPVDDVYSLVSPDGRGEYDARALLACIVDADSLQEYKADYGKTLVCAYARLGGRAVGIVANQRLRVSSPKSGLQMPGVIYADSAEKAARFIMDCNQGRLPLVFLQDVSGFMVGKDAEQSGIIRSGAQLVNALSNSTVPKITVLIGGSYGAGNYALCGKAFDPRFIFAWPNARYAVMGAAQASEVVYQILARGGAKDRDPKELAALRQRVKQDYLEQADIRYAAARGWVDAIIAPHATRETLVVALEHATRPAPQARFHTGVIQV